MMLIRSVVPDSEQIVAPKPTSLAGPAMVWPRLNLDRPSTSTMASAKPGNATKALRPGPLGWRGSQLRAKT
jgi:hypothetical protein